MLHGKSLSPILLALAGGLFLLYLAWPQTVGGLLLVSQERTLDGLAGARYTPPLTSAGLVQAVANWRAAAPRLDDCDTWTGLGDVLTAAARGADAASGLRDALLREAIAAYRKALALGPANARAWTMLTAARLEYDATPAELIPLLRMSLRTGPHDITLAFTRLDVAFFIWRLLDPALQVALQDQVLMAADKDPRRLAAITERHYMLEPVRDMLDVDRVLKWRFDSAYTFLFP